MSSTAEPVKHSSDGDAPNSKRVRVDDKETFKTSDDKSAENNNRTTANLESNNLKKAEPGDSGVKSSSNGNERDRGDKQVEEEDVGNEIDDVDEGEEIVDGEELDSDLEQFDPNVTRNLQKVESIQQQISKLNELASEEILKVEQKFNKLRRPHFEERNNMLKDVPNFWVTCLANHQSITHLIESAEDEDCLHYLINLDVEELDDIKSGYNLKFHFKENPYINNDLIVREIRHLNSDEVVSKSTPIDYKDTQQGRALRSIVENSAGQFTRSGDRDAQFSFIAWMCLPCETGSDEIAEIIKDQIWPSPLEFFFQTPNDDYDGNSDEDDDEDDDDEEDDEEASDDDDDDEAYEEDFANEARLRLQAQAGAGGMPEEDIEGEELEDDDEDEYDDDDDDDIHG